MILETTTTTTGNRHVTELVVRHNSGGYTFSVFAEWESQRIECCGFLVVAWDEKRTPFFFDYGRTFADIAVSPVQCGNCGTLHMPRVEIVQ